MTLVQSEAIAEIDYRSADRTLAVRFVEGDWYSYLGVPPHVHAAFVKAESHGRFFQQNIRDRYAFRRGR